MHSPCSGRRNGTLSGLHVRLQALRIEFDRIRGADYECVTSRPARVTRSGSNPAFSTADAAAGSDTKFACMGSWGVGGLGSKTYCLVSFISVQWSRFKSCSKGVGTFGIEG